jgi:hypothetical protein
MTDTKSTPTDETYIVHALQPSGFGYVAETFPNNEFGVRPGRVEYGEELVVTPALRDANRDRLGVSWLEHDAAAQTAEYGADRHRFGYGPVPANIRAEVAAARRAELQQQRAFLLANNRAAREAAAATGRLAQIDAELSAFDTTEQGS